MAVKRGATSAELGPRADPADASVEDALTLGDALRAARERSGRSLAELSTQTKVHTRYLTAIEQNDFSILPNRVFSIGYVRSYAAALGLDEQSAVERFKRESPDPTVPLQAPSGIAYEDVKRNSGRLAAVGGLLLLAVVGWNIFQRVSLVQAPRPSDIAPVPPHWATDKSVDKAGLRLSGPAPAPADQTVPELYVTPGLELQMTGVAPATPEQLAAAAASATPVRKAFNPRGALYGAPATASHVVLQASKAANIVVRLADGRVLFARQLTEGDAWRAPIGVSATLDVSEPTAFDVYINGEYAGVMPALQVPLSQFNSRAEAQIRQAAEENAERTRQAQLQAARQAATRPSAQTPVAPISPSAVPVAPVTSPR